MEQTGASKRPVLVIIVSLLVIGALGAYIVYSQPDAAVSDPVENRPAANQEVSDQGTPAPSNRMVIKFTNDGFAPAELTVKRGTIVNVRNESDTNVQFSSDDHPAHRGNTEMNMGRLAPGESMSYTADRVGTWGFHDHIDDSKTGTITVEE